MDAKQIETRDAEIPLEISPREAVEALKKGTGVMLVDVRESWEYEICRIAGAKLIPMGTIPAHLQELDTEDEVICYCHHGMRSMDVAVWLRGQGVQGARSLAGGIERWSVEIDAGVARY
jgi:rhodanese-related sulfurtransferase